MVVLGMHGLKFPQHNPNPPKYKLGDLTFSASGTTLSITDGTHTWTLEANS